MLAYSQFSDAIMSGQGKMGKRDQSSCPISLPHGVRMTLRMDSLPAGELVETGLADLQCNRETVPALLVAIGAPKLRKLGLILPPTIPSNPEHRLYDLLAAENSDSAHSKYNALIRKLVSFQRAMECVKK
jgi:hypothetical protein